MHIETNTNNAGMLHPQQETRFEPEWRLFLRKLLIMNIGLMVMSFGIIGTVRANIGASPWDVLHIGLTYHLPISFGLSSQLVGLFVLIFACWMAKRVPTLGCLINIVMVGFYCDWIYNLVPSPDLYVWRVVQFMVGVAVCGYGAGLYISSRLGAGPRDWLMLSVSQKTGIEVRWIRTMLEVSALLAGILLGGPFSVGTILFSLTVGHSTQWGIKWAEKLVRPFVERREISV